MKDFAPAVGPRTMIFPVLNGMRHIDFLAKRFGEDAVIGGVCLVGGRDRQRKVASFSSADFQQLVYGERNGETTPRLQTLDTTLQGAGFDARLSTDIMQAMWEKWFQLASLGAITCLMGGAIGEIVAIPGGADLSLEVVTNPPRSPLRAATRLQNPCSHDTPPLWTAPGSSLTSSMYRDLRKGAPVEVDHILGDD